MIGMERTAVEKLISRLDTEKYLFPEFELYRHEGQLVLLGKGGSAIVYEMRSLQNPDARYVLKVIGFEKYVVSSERFWQTVRVQSMLEAQSPYVMRILDARELVLTLGEDGDYTTVEQAKKERWNEEGLQLQFILMEKLDAVIEKNRFKKVILSREKLNAEAEVLRFSLQIGQALQQAHNNNILHRDIKLENIFWDEINQCYKLGDFGIAKYVENGTADTIVYTDGYGAPEIEYGLQDNYNATADIYSFGITLYLLLNELKFPGADGYYVNLVQYNPQFIFPAPLYASEHMTKVIRKMCSFRKEERYQSMAEVLMDLNYVASLSNTEQENLDVEMVDLPTETYRDKNLNDKNRDIVEKSFGRIERKKEEQWDNSVYNAISGLQMAILSTMCLFFLIGMQSNADYVEKWQFFVLPILALFEAILLRIGEFHIMFGGLTVAFWIYSVCEIGLTAPHILLACCLLTGVPVITASGAVASIGWILSITLEQLTWMKFVGKNIPAWLCLIGIIVVLYKVIRLRIDYDKETRRREVISMWIFDKLAIIIIILGVLLFLLELLGIAIPVEIKQLHFIRTGIILFVLMTYLIWNDSYYYDAEQIEEAEC